MSTILFPFIYDKANIVLYLFVVLCVHNKGPGNNLGPLLN